MSERPDPLGRGADTGADELLGLSEERTEHGTVLTVTGELDMQTSPRLRAALHQRLDERPRCLVVDLLGLGFLGSSGLATLVEGRDAAVQREVVLRLVGNSREVLHPIEATGLGDMFEIHPNVDLALGRR